ncbi:hypothetical protein [Bradyrhizobium sp. SUTN9-2]|nr:hypothetical protein [Bradyrhizobium sp. SUTN9-2]
MIFFIAARCCAWHYGAQMMLLVVLPDVIEDKQFRSTCLQS